MKRPHLSPERRKRLHRRFLRIRDASWKGTKKGASVIALSGLGGAGGKWGSQSAEAITRRMGRKKKRPIGFRTEDR